MIRRVAVVLSALALVALVTPWGAASAGEPPAADKGGCCSHHHGVCGCSAGHAVCCDQTMSPTCGC